MPRTTIYNIGWGWGALFKGGHIKKYRLVLS